MAEAARATWLDRAVGYLSPQLGLRRLRARMAADMLQRHYEAAARGRRTQGWPRSSGDANAALGSSGLSILRDQARDMVRNNAHAKNAIRTITNQVVGWGIVAKPKDKSKEAADIWNAWAGTSACDSDGRHDFAGLQKLVWRTVVEAGEVLIRRRFRRPEDELPIPLQLQIMEPDYIDTLKTGQRLPNGGRIIHGVEYNVIGRRVAYWLFPEHPGAEMFGGAPASVRVPAESILHVFHQERAGQVRGASWFAPVILKLRDWDEYDDAQLMKQKIAACLAVLTSDTDGSAPPLGTRDDTKQPEIDSLEPGMILNVAPGRDITVVQPPDVGDFGLYAEVTLRTIAAGIGTTYEDLTGDYTDLPFSAARMSRMAHWDRVEDWRWQTIIPQFCVPVWDWAMQAATIMGIVAKPPQAMWTARPMPMIEPDKEGLAAQRNIRSGITTQPEVIRERGYDPDELLAEYAEWNKKLDAAGIILDSDPRNTTQAGQPRQVVAAAPSEPDAPDETPPPKPPPKKPGGRRRKQ